MTEQPASIPAHARRLLDAALTDTGVTLNPKPDAPRTLLAHCAGHTFELEYDRDDIAWIFSAPGDAFGLHLFVGEITGHIAAFTDRTHS